MKNCRQRFGVNTVVIELMKHYGALIDRCMRKIYNKSVTIERRGSQWIRIRQVILSEGCGQIWD